jgi:DNA-binding CsgD family transcriptional regulator
MTETGTLDTGDTSQEVPPLPCSADEAETPIDIAPLRSLFDELDEGIFLINEDRQVLYRNKAATRLFDLVVRRRFRCSIDECGSALWTLFISGNMRRIQTDEFTCTISVSRLEVPERLLPAEGGGIWRISATFQESMLPGGLSDLEGRFGLTQRQAEIVRLIGRGYSNRDIADELCLSLSTVNKHIENIYAKTGTSNRLSLLDKLSS